MPFGFCCLPAPSELITQRSKVQILPPQPKQRYACFPHLPPYRRNVWTLGVTLRHIRLLMQRSPSWRSSRDPSKTWPGPWARSNWKRSGVSLKPWCRRGTAPLRPSRFSAGRALGRTCASVSPPSSFSTKLLAVRRYHVVLHEISNACYSLGE